ncbi:MAG TPA: extracellular solute-binding protein [Acidimicrobiales bacterium]|nr:extracellular solute-binding protein [Acidimicrobiales bacterium]
MEQSSTHNGIGAAEGNGNEGFLSRPLSRRRLLGTGLGAAAGAALFGSGLGGVASASGLGRRPSLFADSARAPSDFVFSTWGNYKLYQSGYQMMQAALPEYRKVPFVSHEAAGSTQLREQITTGFVGHDYSSLPNVCEVAWTDIGYLATAGTLMDLTSYLKPYTSQISSAVLDAVTVDGKIMACPWRPNTVLYWYNHKVLSEAGIDGASLDTYDQYIAAGKTLAAYKFSDGKQRYLNTTDTSPSYATWFLTQLGGTLFNKTGAVSDFRNSDKFKNSFELQVELAQQPLSLSMNQYQASWFQALGDGLIATVLLPNWMDQELRENVPQGSGDWRVGEMPAFNGGGNRKALYGAGVVVALDTPNADMDLNWQFMQKSFYDHAITPKLFTAYSSEPCWYPVEYKVGYHSALPYYGGQDPGAVDITVQHGAYEETGSPSYAQVTAILSTALSKAISGTSVPDAISYAWSTIVQQKIPVA